MDERSCRTNYIDDQHDYSLCVPFYTLCFVLHASQSQTTSNRYRHYLTYIRLVLFQAFKDIYHSSSNNDIIVIYAVL